jgi:glycosyltransferase involved in cell wall biosynthesis
MKNMSKVKPYTIGIDATNLRAGGGVTHLMELMRTAQPAENGIYHIVVWGGKPTLKALEAQPWLSKRNPPALDKGLLQRTLWQRYRLSQAARDEGCDVLFVPGGSYAGNFHPMVTMSQNMLPFEPEEAMHFGRWSWMRLKMWLLRQSQGRSFKKADGLIFLTQYARKGVGRWLGKTKGLQALIPHGIEPRFAANPKPQRSAEDYSFDQPFTFLYVSILMPYKHQIEICKAASELRRTGCPVRVRFVGEDWGLYGQQFRKTLRELDPQEDFLIWQGAIPFSELHKVYQDADAFVFASSCENMPNILIEAMTAGLPIACSNRGPMPEVLQNAGIYFDPFQPHDIAEAMRTLINSPELRFRLAAQAKELSKAYSWQRCAKETFEFISKVAASRRA